MSRMKQLLLAQEERDLGIDAEPDDIPVGEACEIDLTQFYQFMPALHQQMRLQHLE